MKHYKIKKYTEINVKLTQKNINLHYISMTNQYILVKSNIVSLHG